MDGEKGFRSLLHSLGDMNPFATKTTENKEFPFRAARKNAVGKKREHRVPVRFSAPPGVRLPVPNTGEDEFQQDHLDYMMNNQMKQSPIDCRVSHRTRQALTSFAFEVYTFRKRPIETFFLAVHLLDTSVQKGVVNSNKGEELGPMVIAAVDIASKVEVQVGIAHHYEDTYDLRKVRYWEIQHLQAIDFVTSRQHVLHFLRLLHSMTLDLVSEGHFVSFWATVKALACLGMLSWQFANSQPSLAAAAVMRIVLAFFDDKIVAPPNAAQLAYLQHTVREYAPVGIALLGQVKEMRERGRKCPLLSYFGRQGVSAGVWPVERVQAFLEEELRSF